MSCILTERETRELRSNIAEPVKYLTCAETAKLLRAALRESFGAKFPDAVFSVQSKSYAGGASITIYWQDGPTEKMVDAVANRFSGADFDGMQDMKTYRDPVVIDGARVRFGADYIFTSRSYGREILEGCAACRARRALGLPGNTVEEMRAARDARKPEWARGRMGDKEKEYDEFIVPQLNVLIELCEAHGIPFVSFFQLNDEDIMGGARVLDVPGCNEALLFSDDAMQHWVNLPDAIKDSMVRGGGALGTQTVFEGVVPPKMGEAILRILKKELEDEGGARE